MATVGVFASVQLNNAVDCSTLEAETFADASQLAHACDAEVEVLAARTEWQTSYATTDNQTRLEISTDPVRVQVDGEWVEPDTTLEFIESGEGIARTEIVRVKAPVFAMSLNAGGPAGRGAPLGTVEHDGYTLEVWFPLELPVPELTDSQAVYQLADGIRLMVSVGEGGTAFLPVVELADADAAARFSALLDAARAENGGVSHGLDLEFDTRFSDGLTLTSDSEDGVHIIDAEGDTQFMASSPIMWDSSGEQIPVSASATEVGVIDRTRAPADGDKVMSMDVAIADHTIVVSPDTPMIESPDTVWPVYIDPIFGPKSATRWVAVRTGGYTGTLQNWGDISSTMLGQGVGYCTSTASCNVVFKQRLAWQYSALDTISALVGSDISAASFTVDGQHSYNCTAQTTTLYRTSSLSTSTTWSNLSWLQSISSRSEYHSNSCGNKGMRSFNALAAAQWVADNNSVTLALGLVTGETSMTPWKRFRHDAKLSITYNQAPTKPSDLQLSSPNVPGCVLGAALRPTIATTTPTLSAKFSDPDAVVSSVNVQASFVVASATNYADVKWSVTNSAGVASGSTQSKTVPSGLVSGGAYVWRVQGYDGARYSPWSDWCEFAVDTSAPAQPVVTPQATGSPATYFENVAGGGKDQLGRFTLSPGDSGAVTAYKYHFDSGVDLPAPAASDGTATIEYPAETVGPHTLTVRASNAAGTLSLPRTYAFVVATATEDAVWRLDEGTGATSADAAGSPARPLTVNGALWTDGPHHLFDSREGDHALRFDGVNDSAVTTAQVVNTEESFVVSAHVMLDATGQSVTALSQDGTTQSGFQLGYTAICPGMPDGCWSFTMPDTADGSAVVAANSSVAVTTGEWTYLLAEHNIITGSVSLWVCEVGTPTDPAVGEPVKKKETRSATPWAAAGVFSVGRGQSSGSGSGWWPGVVDNVRVFSGEVVAESTIRRLCQGADTTDFSSEDGPADPTWEDED